MDRECFVTLVEEVLDALPAEFRKKIRNLTVVVEDQPPERLSRKTDPRLQPSQILLPFIAESQTGKWLSLIHKVSLLAGNS